MRVTLFNGSQVDLDDIRVGDKVKSWDDVLQRPVASIVRDVPRFPRSSADLVQLTLATGRQIAATADHPFWSKTQKKVVSLDPRGAKVFDGVDASLIELMEEFEDENQSAVTVLSIGSYHGQLGAAKHEKSSLVVPSLEVGRPRAEHELEDDEEDVNIIWVKTLYLEPHHWFYVEGVRVHNRLSWSTGAGTYADYAVGGAMVVGVSLLVLFGPLVYKRLHMGKEAFWEWWTFGDFGTPWSHSEEGVELAEMCFFCVRQCCFWCCCSWCCCRRCCTTTPEELESDKAKRAEALYGSAEPPRSILKKPKPDTEQDLLCNDVGIAEQGDAEQPAPTQVGMTPAPIIVAGVVANGSGSGPPSAGNAAAAVAFADAEQPAPTQVGMTPAPTNVAGVVANASGSGPQSAGNASAAVPCAGLPGVVELRGLARVRWNVLQWRSTVLLVTARWRRHLHAFVYGQGQPAAAQVGISPAPVIVGGEAWTS